MAAAATALPLPAAAWCARRLGDVAYAVLGRRRRLALANLAHALPTMPSSARRALARRSFQHIGMVVMEGLFVVQKPIEEITAGTTVEGLEHLQDAVDRHGRALMLTAHLGNWELLTLAPVLTGYPLTVVARTLDWAALNAWADRLRRKVGVEVVDKRDAVRPVLAALRRGGLVGILLDQNASRREGVFVPFFGRLASTSRALALLALRTRTPVIPAFIRRVGTGRHVIRIEPPLPMPEGTDEAAILMLTGRCTQVIENAVRATPDQWLWMHDRWRTRPAEEKR